MENNTESEIYIDFSTHKICSKCNYLKSLDKFGKRSCAKIGYRCTCKQCDKEYLLKKKASINI